jgi:uncharacterized protein YndB with AHSA1/START domain
MTDTDTDTKPAAECEVTLTRIFDAPRDLVFNTWTDPKHMARWWGPRGFTNPVCEMDVRVGGAILIHMHGPGGTVYPMTGTFLQIVVPEKLVFKAVAASGDGPPLLEGLVTATFEEYGGKTKLTVHEKATSLAPAGARMLAGMHEGWAQSLDRLDGLVTG